MAVRVGPVIADRVSAPRPASQAVRSPSPMDLSRLTAPKPTTLAQILRSSGATTGEAQRLANIAQAATRTAASPRPTQTQSAPSSSPLPTNQTAQQPTEEVAEAAPLPAETGNPAVDQANILSSILNSPLYTESIKNAYLTQYLPGLTQANYEINRNRAQEVQNAFLRQQAQARAIREVAGSYAARGMRTPKMVTEGFAPIQQATELERTAAEQAINDLIANKEVLYGAGAQDAETFITDPIMFGSVGAGARRTALSELLQLPEAYGLTQVAQASRSPLAGGQAPSNAAADPTDVMPRVPVGGAAESTAPSSGSTPAQLPANTQTAAQLQARIDAANRYIRQQQAKGNQRTVAGATQKLQGFQQQLAGLGGR